MNTIINKRDEMSFFDSSLSSVSIDATLSDVEYKDTIVSLLKPILEQRFPGNFQKQKIRVHRDRITISCPACGDSMKSDYKQRGNIILTGKFANYYKCFNCNKFLRIDNFLKDFNVHLDLNAINHIANTITDFSTSSNIKYDMSMFLDMESINKYAIDREEFRKYFNLLEVKNSSIWPWLINRLQYDESKFLYDSSLNHLVILNLTQTGRILGAQRRTFKGENKYLSYKLKKLYELMKKNPEEIPDEIDMLSQLFNICLINYSKLITLCEGPLDSFLFNNSIANCGANKAFPLDIPIRYFYDSDKNGREKSIEKINNGEEVFLWEKLKYDLSLPNREKYDLNDLMIYIRDHNVKTPNFEQYFSKNELDIIDI
jgi:hypothetical protein